MSLLIELINIDHVQEIGQEDLRGDERHRYNHE